MTCRAQLAEHRLAGTDPLVDIRDICAWLGVSDAWLRHQLAAERFPKAAFRFGVSLRWKPSTVERYLAGKATGMPNG